MSASTTTNGISTTVLRKNTKAWAVEQGRRKQNFRRHNQKGDGAKTPGGLEDTGGTGRRGPRVVQGGTRAAWRGKWWRVERNVGLREGGEGENNRRRRDRAE